MKIRTDFVTNSSSSSFCIIGTRNKNIIKQLLKSVVGIEWELEEDQIKYEDQRYNGVLETENINFYGYNSELPYKAGMEAEPLLEIMTIPEAKKYFKEFIKNKYNIDITSYDIYFEYGESRDD